jgi:hypothetical protein
VAGRREDLVGGYASAFDAEDRAGAGKGGIPGDAEMNAAETVRGLIGHLSILDIY